MLCIHCGGFVCELIFVSETDIGIGTSSVVIDAWISVKACIKNMGSGGDSEHIDLRTNVPDVISNVINLVCHILIWVCH